MTNEESIKHLHDDWYIENGRLCVDGDKKDAFLESAGMGIKALRPVSRERVEKVWRGEWVKCKHADYYVCNKCSTVSKTGEDEFCKSCGAPMTDEAVEMVMERLEALHGEKESD